MVAFPRFTFTTLFIICPPGAARLVRAAKGELDFANSMDMLSPEFCLITEFQEGQTQAPDAVCTLVFECCRRLGCR